MRSIHIRHRTLFAAMAVNACLALLLACGDGGDAEARKPEGQADCGPAVNAALQAAQGAGDAAAAMAVLENALASLSDEGGSYCERELLLELAEIAVHADSTQRIISACERALRPDLGLDSGQVAQVKMKLAAAYFKVGLPKSFDLARDAFLYLQAANIRSDRMLEATDLLVNTYELTDELGECERLLSTALDIALKENDVRWSCDLRCRLGTLATRQGRAREAIELHQQALRGIQLFFRNGAVRDTLVSRSNGGEELLTGHQYLAMRTTALIGLGEAYAKAGLADSAVTMFSRVGEMQQRTPIKGVRVPYAAFGATLLSLGRTEEALDQATQGLRAAVSAGDVRAAQRSAALLHAIWKRKGDAARALHMLELANAYGDSLDNEAFKMGVLKSQVTYEARNDSLRMALRIVEGDKNTAEAQVQAQKNRNRAFGIGGIALLLLLGGGLWYRTDRRRRQERFEKDAAVLETQALRSQMNPHFIFNALNSINAFVQGNDPDMASSYLSKFARVMRLVLENSRHAEVPLESDLEALRGYLDLERKRSRDKFDYHIEIDPELDPAEVMVPPLVVQPFVENAIWHGMAGKEDKGHITLRIQKKGEQLLWIIEDDGVGRNAKKPDPPPEDAPAPPTGKKTSLGTAITRARLDLVQKQYGGKAGWRYVDTASGTRVEVDMPMRLAG